MWQLTRIRLRDSIDDHPKGKTVKEVLDNYQSRAFGAVSDNLLSVVMTFTMTIRSWPCYPWRCSSPGDSGPLRLLYIGERVLEGLKVLLMIQKLPDEAEYIWAPRTR